MVKTNQKECINIKFSEGMGIFDAHYRYPEIDKQEIYNGPTGKVKDIQGIQAHAGRDFFVPEGMEFSFDIDDCPYLHIAIKAEKDTKTCLIMMVHDKEPNDHKNRFVVIGKTPEGDPGIYDVIADCFTIEDDNQWHEYDLDLRNIREKDDEYPYFPGVGSVSIIQFYSWTETGEHIFHFNDLVCKPLTITSKPLVIKGKILYADDKPYAGGIVRAFDMDLRRKELLGEAKTNLQGDYEIKYSPEQFHRDEKGSADLLVCVVDEKGIKLVSSDVLFNAPDEAVIDLILPSEPERLSEYELLANAILPLLKGQGEGGEDLPVAELEEKDIDFLAKDSGEQKERIAFLVAAAKAALDSGESIDSVIPMEAFYGWFRQGLPASLPDLQKQNADILRRALETSLHDNIIPALGDSVDTIISRLRQVAVESLLKPGGSDGRASFGDLLSTVQSNSEKQRKVANLFISHQGNTEAFWNALRETPDFDKVEIGQIQTTLQLGTLTSNHLPLVCELQRIGQDDPELNEMRGLARLELADWVDIISRPQENGQSIGVPQEVQGEDESARIKTYAANLNSYIEKTFPTAVIAHRLDKDNLEDSPLKEAKDDFKTFFGNNPGFEFREIPIDIYLSKDSDKKLKGIKQKEKLIPHLKNMERVLNVTQRYPELRALLVDNLHSATAMVYVGERRFTEKYAELLGGPSKAREIFRKAEQVHATALNVYMKHSVAFNSPLPYVISGGERRRPVAHDQDEVTEFVDYSFLADNISALREVPDYSTLFGSLNLCDCRECRSLYSPAAYLADILKFLDSGPMKDGMSPLEVLLTRRPDIENIELTCENTNTQLPYVDLANEILEAGIVPRIFEIVEGADISTVLTELKAGEIPAGFLTAFANKGYSLTDKASVRVEKTGGIERSWEWIILDSGWAFSLKYQGSHEGFSVIAWPQTSLSSDELRANPEHIHTQAYTVLQRAVYPWNLPLNSPLEEMRAYLGHLGVKRHEVMEVFFRGLPSDALFDKNIAHEYLGLTNEEVDIIAGVTTGAPAGTTTKVGPWDFWGLQEDASIPDPADSTKTITGKWNKVLKRVDVFLQQSGLSYKELLELLSMSVINPVKIDGTRMLSLESTSTDPKEAVTCNLSMLQIRGLDVTNLYEMHRFVRLFRKLGWTMRDLDKVSPVLKGFKLPFIYQNLILLSHIQRLRANLNVPLVNILSWWADIDTARYIDHFAEGQPKVKSLYERLFLNKAIINPEDSAFELNSTRNELKNPSTETNHVTIHSHIPVITAALGISDADLSLLLRIIPSISQQGVIIATNGSGVDRTNYRDPMFVLDLGEVTGADNRFTIKFQESDDDSTYNDISDGDLRGEGQPAVINQTNDDKVIRCRYRGTKKFLRVAVTNVQGTSPSLPMSAQVVLGYDKVSDELNLANLSLLYRISSLAKALKLSIHDWLIVRELTGMVYEKVNPFYTTRNTMRFIEKVGVIRASGFSINELDYLLRHEFTPSSGVALAEEAIAVILDEIRRGLQKIAAENVFSKDPDDPNGMTTDPAGELTRKKLALLDWNITLIEQIVATLNGTMTYEALTDPIFTDLVLPNDKGIYEVNLLSLPDGFIFPVELAGVVTSVPRFKFACNSGIPIKSASEKISTELYDQFIAHHFAIDINAMVTTETPDTTWKINGQYLLVKSGELLSIYDLNDLKLRASRLLSKPEQDILLNVAAGLSDLKEATESLIALQKSLQGQIAYDQVTINGETKGRLRFAGPMTNIRKAKLDTVSSDQNYQDAVQKLYNAPRKFIRRYMRTFSVQNFATDLAALPSLVKFPNTLKSKVYFDAASKPKQLHFIGVMTEQERDMLLDLSTVTTDTNHTSYQDAVRILFAKSNADFAATLTELPASVKFPDTLNDKTYFDNIANPKRLHFIGVMTEQERDMLLALSTLTTDTNHTPYQRAIGTLFLNSNAFVMESSDIFLTVNGQDNDITTILNKPTTPEDRFLCVLQKLIPYIRQTLSERLVAQKMAEALQLETKTAEEMLTKWVISPTLPAQKSISEFLAPLFADSDLNVNLTAAVFPDQFRTFTLLHKIAGLVIKFKITPNQLKWLFDYGPSVGWLNLNTLPLDKTDSSSVLFAGWERLVDLFRLRDQLPLGESVLSEIFSVARDATTTEADVLQKLSKHTGWGTDDLQLLVGAQGLGFTFPDSYRDERALMRLYSCFKIMKILGASAKQLSDWGKTNQTSVEELDNARSIKNAVKAKYDDKQWLEVAKPLKDPLREKQRKALVAYLIMHPAKGQHWRDVSELYEYFLIDVEMSPCMMTTRIKQAISSVQLFIQRCFMNLESDVFLTPEKAQEWTQWRKWYRVWQANRKVLFYPENWIEPELRDDKSPFYKDLENELLQSDVTEDTAEDAFLHYLEKLDQVARLEIVGMYLQYKQPEADIQHVFGKQPETDILHVFGRTYAIPHIYFYRRLEGNVTTSDLTNANQWSAWEKVDLDIEGDHLIPVEWNRRLYLFWAIFTEKSEQPTKEQRKNDDDPNKYWEIKLAWSEYKNERWSPKKVSKDYLRFDKYPYSPLDVPQEPQDFSFKTRVLQGLTGEQLSIECYGTGVVVVSPTTQPTTTQTPDPRVLAASYKIELYTGDTGTKGEIWVKFLMKDESIRVIYFKKSELSRNSSTISYVFSNFGVIDGIGIDLRDVRKVKVEWMESDKWDAWAFNGIEIKATLTSDEIVPVLINNQPLYSSNPIIRFDDSYGKIQSWTGNVSFADRPDPKPVPVSTPASKPNTTRMQGIGEFVLDDCNGNLVVTPDSQLSMAPTQLIPIPATKFESMAIVEYQNTQDSMISNNLLATNNLLAKTPGTFRLLGMHQRYESGNIRAPYFYQDDSSTYFVTNISQPGSGRPQKRPTMKNLFLSFYHPKIGNFIKSLNRYGIKGLLTLANQRLTIGNHFYTASTFERDAIQKFGYQSEGIACYVFDHQVSDTIPLYRFGYGSEGSAFYVYQYNVSGTNPLYWLFSSQIGDHFYTISTFERDDAIANYGYTSKGIAGYVFDSQIPGTTKLYRLINAQIVFNQKYNPGILVGNPRPIENVDFELGGAYSSYNWELFFHTPFLIAIRLSKNQRFEEAQKWFHYIFDPTSTDSPDRRINPGSERFWRVMPFYAEAQRIQTLEELIFDSENSDELKDQIENWQANPFKPHAIARRRVVAYMKAVVMRYIDNLIEWGDQLFRRDTIESINEATQLYILAGQILGKRPEDIPARAREKIQTFRTLDDMIKNGELDSLSNAVVEIESFLPPSVAPTPAAGTQGGTLLMPFFCIPGNDKLLGYWDTVADRLFKIRHCMNIEGVERSLPIFEPKIDPGLMVRAAAAGIDIASALNDINAAIPHYRFNVMVQKASELCNDVKALGGTFLAALEKRDAEALALLRSSDEVELLKAIREIKTQQINEAKNTYAGLMKYQDVVTARQLYYQSRLFMNPFEIGHLALTTNSLIPMSVQVGAEISAAIMHLIPNSKGGSPPTVGVTYGGANIASAVQAFGSVAGISASMLNTGASLSATLGSYQRRQEDWTHQADLAAKELKQVEKQIIAAEIRLAISESELQNHDLQIENAKEVDAYMRDQKFTNQQLYSWMVGQLSGIYFQSYQLAYDVAKRAERTYRYELGLKDSNFIQFGYWDSLKKGLLSGERLHHDLKRMEVAYLDQNKREYEITKHISLITIDPISLLKLKETCECFVSLPESLFDIDYPGHYMRRIKSVSITIPCVTGPYAGVNCTLTQHSSTIRHANILSSGKYTRQGDDTRFSDSFGTIQSIVTSSGQNDSGLFEANMRDERYLPFEGQGAISTWRIQLPKQFKSFDYDTISDVILHLRYTAREGGALLKQNAERELQTAIEEFIQTEGKGLARIFSLRHEFPSEWYRFLNPPADGVGGQKLTMALTKERFPFFFQGKTININAIELFVKIKKEFSASHNESTLKFTLAVGAPTSGTALPTELPLVLWNGLLRTSKDFNNPPDVFTLNAWVNTDTPLDPKAIQDILVVCRYTCP